VLDGLWQRLCIGAALPGVAADRRLDVEETERVLFSLVARRGAGTRSAERGEPTEQEAAG
jgi:hypothetical protein